MKIEVTFNLKNILESFGCNCFGDLCEDCPSSPAKCLKEHRQYLQNALDEMDSMISTIEKGS